MKWAICVFTFFTDIISLYVSQDVMHLIQYPIKYFHIDFLHIAKLNNVLSIFITKTLLDIYIHHWCTQNWSIKETIQPFNPPIIGGKGALPKEPTIPLTNPQHKKIGWQVFAELNNSSLVHLKCTLDLRGTHNVIDFSSMNNLLPQMNHTR